ncbi:MAG TPA: DUF6519 domain-containing protein [Thermoanaerobaculia bacterium]|jgi:hypothetical protein|nr:DUF6519 domain-containing protein [Thermoanaerobaculia bacterium]
MRSRATGDFSRGLSEPDRRYSAVWMQQGRVQLDSDWNDQAEILGRHAELAAADLIGQSGAPFPNAGFGISLLGELAFDGRDDYAYVAAPPAPRPSTEDGAGFTWEAWIRPAAGGGAILGRFAQGSTDSGGAASSDAAVVFLNADGRLAFSRKGIQAIEIAADQPLAFGRVVHVAVTSSTRSTAIWVDGRQAAHLPVGRALADLPAVFLIGAALEGRRPHMPFAGRIHDVRWWHRAFGPAEVAAAATRGALAQTDAVDLAAVDLAAYWPLDENEGDAIHDRTQGGADGVLGAGVSRPEWAIQDLGLSAGRFYVAGVACENFAPTRYSAQRDAPGLTLPDGGVHLAYLDVWERFVTSIQDPAIAEVALGGPTTTTRSQTLAQVRLLPVDGEGERKAKETWEAFLAEAESPRGALAARRSAPTTIGNLLYRIEIHDPGLPLGAAAPDADSDDAETPRVLTYKWSRDNGARTFPILSLAGAQVTLSSPESGRLTVPYGAIVEWLDDPIELSGKPGNLYQVTAVDSDLMVVTLAPTPEETVDAARNPFLRLWDHAADAPAAGATATTPTTLAAVAKPGWLPIESGIEISFAGNQPNRSGDFWWIPARSRTEGIEWPSDPAGRPRPMPPAGPDRAFALLAEVHLDPPPRVEDRRYLFQPVSIGAVSKAGDAMYGPLEIRSHLDVQGAVRAPMLFGRLGTTNAVGTREIADRAVEPSKLSRDIGIVPPGFSILGDTPEPPPGYVWTGSRLSFGNEDPTWRTFGALPRSHPGAISAFALGTRLFALLETGELWEIDPATGEPALASRLPEARRGFAAAADGARIYVAGGFDAAGHAVGTLEVYDADSGAWSRHASLKEPRGGLALAALGGKLHAVGGRTGTRYLGYHEGYDPLTDQWTRLAPLPVPRWGLAACAAAGALHALGGERHIFWFGRTLSRRHDEYRVEADAWRKRTRLLYGRLRPALAAIDGRLLLIGGEGTVGASNTVQSYEPPLGWIEGPPLPLPAAAPGAAELGGALYAIGGRATDPAVPCAVLAVASVLYVHKKVGGEEVSAQGDVLRVGVEE